MEDRPASPKMLTIVLITSILWIFTPNYIDAKIVEGTLNTKEACSSYFYDISCHVSLIKVVNL